MGLFRETRHDDRNRTRELMACLGASLTPPDEGVDPAKEQFEQVVGRALYANDSANPPAGHRYPKRG
ncbi:hypothetical protein [Streptomyces sp. NPDC048659]|uniref:hypothetical protein n=1 Tax=Streptomyces sp. NPDC048659 TaxID=3155489 RepID=UPI003417FBC2